MIRVTFNGAVAEMLEQAMRFGRKPYVRMDKAIDYVFNEEPGDGRRRASNETLKLFGEIDDYNEVVWKKTRPLGKEGDLVAGLALDLQFGDISGTCLDQTRCREFGYYWKDRINPAALDRFAEDHVKSIAQLVSRIQYLFSMGETIQIWYGCNARDLCGLYWFASQLEDVDTGRGTVEEVICPESRNLGELYGEFSSWDYVSARNYSKYEKKVRRVMSRKRLSRLADMWYRHQNENREVRRLYYGEVIGTDLSAYAPIIEEAMKSLPEGASARELAIAAFELYPDMDIHLIRLATELVLKNRLMEESEDDLRSKKNRDHLLN